MSPWTRLACASIAVLVCAAACASTATRPDREPEKKARVAKKRERSAAPAETPTASEPVTQTPPLAIALPPSGDAKASESGLASYYADSLAGNKTASGERYRPTERTCAHRTHKFGTSLVVTAVDSGKTAVCRVNDRGPFVAGRVLDVSRRVADELGMKSAGVIRVRIEVAPDGSGT